MAYETAIVIGREDLAEYEKNHKLTDPKGTISVYRKGEGKLEARAHAITALEQEAVKRNANVVVVDRLAYDCSCPSDSRRFSDSSELEITIGCSIEGELYVEEKVENLNHDSAPKGKKK